MRRYHIATFSFESEESRDAAKSKVPEAIEQRECPPSELCALCGSSVTAQMKKLPGDCPVELLVAQRFRTVRDDSLSYPLILLGLCICGA